MRAIISRAGALCTGGLLLAVLVPLPLGAQQRADRSVEDFARVVERGSHHARWETVREIFDPLSGQRRSETNTYYQLESGLHYQDERGNWQSASEEIEVLPGEAVARKGQHQARWAANINTYGAITVVSAEGQVLRSHVLGLAYHDPTTGENLMIAKVKDSHGGVNRNQVIYQDAFDGVQADLRYTYTKAGFVQDVILRSQLPDPVELGFDPATVQVQVMTEFVELPATTLARMDAALPSAATNRLAGANAAARYTKDAAVGLGSMQIEPGRAFALPEGGRQRSTPVRKVLERFQGDRNILVETVDYPAIAPELIELPQPARRTAALPQKTDQQATLRVAPSAPEQRVASVDLQGTDGLLMASVDASVMAGRGYLIDYDLNAGTTNNLTLQGDTTYYITGLVTATGVTKIEGGTVIKFANTNNAELKLKGTIKCLTDPYRPAIFTAKDDNSVGTTISGSSGSPSGYYAVRALNIDDNTSDLRHVHIRHAKQGVYYGAGSAYPHFLTHVQMVQVGEGVVSLSKAFHVRNGLFHNVITNFTTTGSAITGNIEHLTSHLANRLNGSGNLTLNLTNSLLVQLTNSSSYNDGGGNASAASNVGVFAANGAGAHYLAASSTNRNAGVTNINYQLKTSFQSMTTHAPLSLTNTTITADTVLGPVVQRDTDVPDRGYHYQALDYLISVLTVTNSTLTLTNGVSLASVGSTGIWMQDSAKLDSTGSPGNFNILCEYNSVQEQPQLLSAYNTITLINPYFNSTPSISAAFRFTKISCDIGSYFTIIYYYGSNSWKIGTLTVQDSEFLGGGIQWNNFSHQGTADFRNNLFDRFTFAIQGEPALTCYNGTFHGGSLSAWTGATYGILFKDNLFDAVSMFDLSTLTHDYNGYVNGSDRLTTNQVHDIVIGSLAYETGPWGRFYLPSGTSLINAGSRNATNAGLYHFTTQVGQAKETNSVVDIGYHYVAANPASAELAKATLAPTGSTTCCGWDASYTTNNLITDPGWANSSSAYGSTHEYLRIDLGSSKSVGGVGYISRDGTTPSPLYDAYNNGVLREYKIYVTDSTSTNPANWGTAAFVGRFNFPNGQERRDLEFDPKSGRYVYYYRVNGYGWYGPEDPNYGYLGWPGYAGANEIWIRQYNSVVTTAIDTDGDTPADYFEDVNGDGSATGDPTSWQSYNSPSGLTGSPGLSVFTPFKP